MHPSAWSCSTSTVSLIYFCANLFVTYFLTHPFFSLIASYFSFCFHMFISLFRGVTIYISTYLLHASFPLSLVCKQELYYIFIYRFTDLHVYNYLLSLSLSLVCKHELYHTFSFIYLLIYICIITDYLLSLPRGTEKQIILHIHVCVY